MVNKITTKYEDSFLGFAESRIGGRAENQDTCAFTDTPLGLLVLVCDGMGGGPGGKTASMLAAKTITDHMASLKPTAEIDVEIKKAIDLANEAIYNYTDQNPALRGMGSTVTLLLLTEECAFVAHVGDSRIYQLRGHSVVYRSTDHSKVMELVKSGVINEEQARTSGESNIITQALGHGEDLKADIERLSYLKGDRFVLCSDGIWGMFPQKQLIKMLSGAKNPAGAVDNTVISVDEMGKSEGGRHDNLTLAIVDTNKNSLFQPPMKKSIKILISSLAAIALISIIVNVVLFAKINNNRPAAVPAYTSADELPSELVDSIVNSRLEAQRKAFDKRIDSISKKISDAEAKKMLTEVTANSEIVEQLKAINQKLDALQLLTDDSAASKMTKEAVADLTGLTSKIKGYAGADAEITKAIDELKKPISSKTSHANFKSQIGAIKKFISNAINIVSTN